MNKATYTRIAQSIGTFHKGMVEGIANPLRLLIDALNLIGSYENLPADVADHLILEVTRIYDAAVNGYPIPAPKVAVLWTVNNGSIVVDKLPSFLNR